jgi:hypothetical protein
MIFYQYLTRQGISTELTCPTKPDATALLVEYTPTILVLENTTVINLKNAPCLAIISERKKFPGKIPATNQVR